MFIILSIFGFSGILAAFAVSSHYLFRDYDENISKTKILALATLNLAYGIPCLYKAFEIIGGHNNGCNIYHILILLLVCICVYLIILLE